MGCVATLSKQIRAAVMQIWMEKIHTAEVSQEFSPAFEEPHPQPHQTPLPVQFSLPYSETWSLHVPAPRSLYCCL